MGIQTFSYDQVKLFPLTIYKSKFGITQDEQLSNPIVTQLGFWPNKGFDLILQKVEFWSNHGDTNLLI